MKYLIYIFLLGGIQYVQCSNSLKKYQETENKENEYLLVCQKNWLQRSIDVLLDNEKIDNELDNWLKTNNTLKKKKCIYKIDTIGILGDLIFYTDIQKQLQFHFETLTYYPLIKLKCETKNTIFYPQKTINVFNQENPEIILNSFIQYLDNRFKRKEMLSVDNVLNTTEGTWKYNQFTIKLFATLISIDIYVNDL